MITLFLTRHAKSTRNYYDEKTTLNMNDSIFRDCALCPEGIESIIKNRERLQGKIGNVDIILTSPMKRCIQTTLATYESKNQKINPIYVMPLITEFGNGYDSMGKTMNEICTDPDIFEYKHFPALDFERFFSEGMSSSIHNNMNNLSWTNVKFLMDESRIGKFLSLLKDKFVGKRIHAFSHSGFIRKLTGCSLHNYQTICVTINTENNILSWKLI
jgi:broad specificity phosphatase PhoE